jgi:hypothetical protein
MMGLAIAQKPSYQAILEEVDLSGSLFPSPFSSIGAGQSRLLPNE